MSSHVRILGIAGSLRRGSRPPFTPTFQASLTEAINRGNK
jgi:hypothetical protein